MKSSLQQQQLSFGVATSFVCRYQDCLGISPLAPASEEVEAVKAGEEVEGGWSLSYRMKHLSSVRFQLAAAPRYYANGHIKVLSADAIFSNFAPPGAARQLERRINN